MSNQKIVLDLHTAYTALVLALRTNCQNLLPEGIGGMWTPDAEEDNGDLILRSYSGGYEHHLVSRRFNFKLVEGYTFANGTQINLASGSLEDIQRALDFYEIR